MGGSNYIHHAAGMLESMLTVAYKQYVGPGGNFMTSPHTLEYMRSEFFEGNGVSDRRNREKWEQEGSLDARVRARKIARELISGAPESCLPEEVDKTIRKKFDILL